MDFIDDKSLRATFGWNKLTNVMTHCWAQELERRPSFISVHAWLEAALDEQSAHLPPLRDVGYVVQAAADKARASKGGRPSISY